jgi:hypothetical protein
MNERIRMMLKRSLLAAGLLGLASGANAVSSIAANTELTLTPQLIGAAGVVVEAKDFVITVGDDIDLNGKSMQIDFSVAPVAALLPATLTPSVCGGTVISGITYAGLTNGGKTVNYSIAGDNADPSTCKLPFPIFILRKPM